MNMDPMMMSARIAELESEISFLRRRIRELEEQIAKEEENNEEN